VSGARGQGVALAVGYGADLLFGDPGRLHPVAGFGRLAASLERIAYAPSRLRGTLVTAALVTAAGVAAELAGRRGSRPLVVASTTWAALGGRSLRGEALTIAELIEHGRLAQARRALRALCGRDADELDADGLCRAVVESLAENTSDAVVGALAWGAAGGAAGVACYRAANTLDSMFGHRNARYERFGWAAAHLDDLMSWPAARLTVLICSLVAPLVGGSPARAIATALRDGARHPSPNAGRVEGAFAGALGVRLGGPLAYGGRAEHRPWLGDGRAPEVGDIRRAARLSWATGTTAAALSVLAREVRA
jgi:adenosylcobinamide-phosphate synthase